jgi:acyl-CoA synthetase (AMP-forming)/AMP-acid ligase II
MASPEAFSGYRNRPDADARAIRDGWYLTGDLAAEDSDGDLWVTGRVDDMINSGGENIYPDEIESALARCPAVSADRKLTLDGGQQPASSGSVAAERMWELRVLRYVA